MFIHFSCQFVHFDGVRNYLSIFLKRESKNYYSKNNWFKLSQIHTLINFYHMRKLLLLFCLGVTFAGSSQVILRTENVSDNVSSEIIYQYQFSIVDVKDPASAKEITDDLRRIFNLSSSPLKHYPTFKKEDFGFFFTSEVSVDQEKLKEELTKLNLELTSFTKTKL